MVQIFSVCPNEVLPVNFCSGKFADRYAAAKKKSEINNTGDSDKYASELALQKKRNNLLEAGVVGLYLSALATILAGAALASRGNSNGAKRSSSIVTKTFESLINNKEIPTIETCKSLDNNLKDFLQKRVNYIKSPDVIKEKINKNNNENRLLLYGSPGTGKTYFGKIFAKTIDADFMEIKFADFNSKWIGEDIEKMQSLFNNIITTASSEPKKRFVVVFNEIDTSIQPLEKLSNINNNAHLMYKIEERGTLLNYIDEIAEKAPNVTIIGTTNQSPLNNNLDSAILSRFKNIIKVDYPTRDNLFEALKYNLNMAETTKEIIDAKLIELKNLAYRMECRKFSFRDLNKVIEMSKDNYIEDNLVKSTKYKYEHLEKAFNSLKYSDGELEGINKKGKKYESKSYISMLWNKVKTSIKSSKQ